MLLSETKHRISRAEEGGLLARGILLNQAFSLPQSGMVSNTVHVDLLEENGIVLPYQGDIFLSYIATYYNLVAQLVGYRYIVILRRGNCTKEVYIMEKSSNICYS